MARQHADTTLFMDHAVPNCASREIFRAVVDDRAHSVFQGRIIVRPHAQKTDAKMMTRALLLSDEAEADNKPELEIFADDVTCGHGATTGALDESLLFYLRARGLSEKEAQALLIQAFVGEAIESIVNDDLREIAIAAAQRWLEATGMSKHPAVANGSYDVARVREDFPALAMKVYGKPLVYLDNAASAQKPTAVLDRMTEAYKSEYANVHRGLHYLANAATEAYEGGRAKVAKFLNAERTEEIIFTRNATEAINLVASSWGEPNIKAGDEIVLSIMEHHSNIVPWHFLRERHGAVIKWAPVDDEGNFLIDEFEKLLTDAHQAGRDHADVERARHRRAGQGRGEARACPRHSGAGRRQPGGGASRDRRAGHRLRFLRLHRPQAVRSDRDRRALCEA